MTLIINLLKCVVLKRWAELGCSFHSVVIVVVAVVPVVISSRNYFSPEIFPPLLILRIASGQENKEPAFNTSLITSRSLWRLAVLCFFFKPPSVGLCGKCVYGHVLIWTPSYLAHLDACVCVLQRWCRVSELERAVSGLSSHHAAPEAADLPLPHPPRPGRVCGRPHRVHGTSSCSTPPSHTCVRFKAQKPASFPDERSLIFWVTNSDPLPRLLPVSVLVTGGKQLSWPPEEPEMFYWYIKPDWSSVLSSPCMGSTPRSQRC